jgi:AcrR family transcriptional regulator
MEIGTDRTTLNRGSVVSAARSLIMQEGLDAVSLRRLAQRLGVTAPALYAYVTDKDDLLRTVSMVEFRRLMGRFEVRGSEEPVTSLRRFCHDYVDYATSFPTLYKTMFLYPPLDVRPGGNGFGLPLPIGEFAAPYDAVAAAMEAGVLRPANPLLVTLTVWSAVHGLAELLMIGMPGTDAERDELIEQVIDTTFEGLRAHPGTPGQGTAA